MSSMRCSPLCCHSRCHGLLRLPAVLARLRPMSGFRSGDLGRSCGCERTHADERPALLGAPGPLHRTRRMASSAKGPRQAPPSVARRAPGRSRARRDGLQRVEHGRRGELRRDGRRVSRMLGPGTGSSTRGTSSAARATARASPGRSAWPVQIWSSGALRASYVSRLDPLTLGAPSSSSATWVCGRVPRCRWYRGVHRMLNRVRDTNAFTLRTLERTP